ncbi:MAG TPA: GNAT family N-acetyltransferase [Candidatus Limnocylindria bacterium]
MNAVAERELVEAIESTLFIYPAVHGLSQDLGIPGLRGRITKLSHPLANLCGDARFSEREADAMIEKVRQRYGDLAFGWLTGPSTRPGDLPSRLEAAGLQNVDSIAGMALTDLALPIEVDPKIRVREVSWQEAVANSEVMARAYGLPTEVMRLFNEIVALSADRIKARPYVASLGDDAIVAWAWLVYLPDSPTVLLGGAATLEQYRGHGFYTALVARRLADARADGRTAAVIQGDRRTSAPICAKLGFREICGLEIFASAHE